MEAEKPSSRTFAEWLEENPEPAIKTHKEKLEWALGRITETWTKKDAEPPV